MSSGALLAAAVAASMAAGPAERGTLANGLVLWRQESGAGPVRIAAIVRTAVTAAGDAADDSAAAALLLPWMRFGGTRSLSAQEVARGLAEMGAELSCEVAADRVVLELRVDAARFRPAIRLFADILMYPAFEEAHRKDAVAAPCGSVTRPAALAALWPQSSPRGVSGLPTRERVMAYHRRMVVPERMVLVVDGGLAALDVAHEARAALETWSPESEAGPPASLPAQAPRTAVVHGTAPGRATVYYMLAGATAADADYAAQAVLGFAVLRQAAASLAPEGGHVRGLSLVPGLGQLITAEMPEATAARADRVLASTLAAIGEGRAAAATLDAERRDALHLLAPELSSPGAAMVYGASELAGRDGAGALAARLKKVSDRELRRAAGRVYE